MATAPGLGTGPGCGAMFAGRPGWEGVGVPALDEVETFPEERHLRFTRSVAGVVIEVTVGLCGMSVSVRWRHRRYALCSRATPNVAK